MNSGPLSQRMYCGFPRQATPFLRIPISLLENRPQPGQVPLSGKGHEHPDESGPGQVPPGTRTIEKAASSSNSPSPTWSLSDALRCTSCPGASCASATTASSAAAPNPDPCPPSGNNYMTSPHLRHQNPGRHSHTSPASAHTAKRLL